MLSSAFGEMKSCGAPWCGTDRAIEEDGGAAKARNRELNNQLKAWGKKEASVVKILLLGTGESGKSTITKQMKIIHINGFNETERMERVADIRKNVKDAILSIVGAMSALGIELRDSTNQTSVDFLMTQAVAEDFDYPQEFYDHALRLWQDDGVQESFSRSHEYQLIDSAKYFLDRIHQVRQSNYMPSDQDILRCRVMTNSIQRIDFNVRDGKVDIQFSVFDVGGQQGERRKWIQVFDTATAILFLLDCSSFDLNLREDQGKNRLLEAVEIFDQVWNNRFLRPVNTILFINKIDVLEEKINAGKSLNTLIDQMKPTSKYYNMFAEFKDFTKPKDSERKEFLDALPRRQMPEESAAEVNKNDLKNGGSSEATGNRLGVKGRMNSFRGMGSFKKKARSSVNYEVNEEVVNTAVFIKRVFMQIKDTRRPGDYGLGDWHENHNCEYYYTCAVDTDNIRKVLEGCRSLIIRKHLKTYV